MRRGRIFFYLAFILILGLVAAFVVWQRVINKPEAVDTATEAIEPTPVITMVDVVMIAQAVPRGAKLREDMLKIVELPQDTFFGEMFHEMAAVVGRQAKFNLVPGIPVTFGMLVDTADQLSSIGSLAALSIKSGNVAVSIPIDRLSSVSYAPRQGDKVSVIVSMPFVDIDSEFQSALPNQVSTVAGTVTNAETGDSTITIQVGSPTGFQGRTELDPILNELTYIVPSEQQRVRLVTQIVLYSAEVLQIGDFTLPEEEKAEEEKQKVAGTSGEGEDEQASEDVFQQQGDESGEQEQVPPPEPPDVITLIVTPQEAVTLNYLLATGARLTLALRAAGDESITTTDAATLQYLLDVYSIPVPAKLPYAMESQTDVPELPYLENEQAEEPPSQ
ncbi:MAG: hypothetical protein U9P49_04265 [Thermodesulfobacteriota bacterium]|nr:hypothetical protein [Thermodesulfobacteriota bacterium]